jgi:dsRNA-specific ribonuclease
MSCGQVHLSGSRKRIQAAPASRKPCLSLLLVSAQGLLVAHELRERLRPAWLPRAEAPSANKMLEAITHRSSADSIDFERYELLGDAFLKFSTANHLYTTRKEGADEGSLSLELHRRVSNGTLWRCAVVRAPVPLLA